MGLSHIFCPAQSCVSWAGQKDALLEQWSSWRKGVPLVVSSPLPWVPPGVSPTELFFVMLQTTSHRLSRPYSNCTEDGADVPVKNLYNKSYSLQVNPCWPPLVVAFPAVALEVGPIRAGPIWQVPWAIPSQLFSKLGLSSLGISPAQGPQDPLTLQAAKQAVP